MTWIIWNLLYWISNANCSRAEDAQIIMYHHTCTVIRMALKITRLCLHKKNIAEMRGKSLKSEPWIDNNFPSIWSSPLRLLHTSISNLDNNSNKCQVLSHSGQSRQTSVLSDDVNRVCGPKIYHLLSIFLVFELFGQTINSQIRTLQIIGTVFNCVPFSTVI